MTPRNDNSTDDTLAKELCRVREHNHEDNTCIASREEAAKLTVLDEEQRQRTPDNCAVCLNGEALRDAAELVARWDAAEHGPTLGGEAIPPTRNRRTTAKCPECDQWYMFWYADTKGTA